MSFDILDRLQTDPGKRTLGELLQDREAAIHEIKRLRAEIERLRTLRTEKPGTEKSESPSAPLAPASQPTYRAGTLLRLPDVCAFVGLSRSAIYRGVISGNFSTSGTGGRENDSVVNRFNHRLAK